MYLSYLNVRFDTGAPAINCAILSSSICECPHDCYEQNTDECEEPKEGMCFYPFYFPF